MDKIIQILPLVGISCILIALFCEVILRIYKKRYNKRTGAYTLEGNPIYDSIEYWTKARNKTLVVSVASFVITGILTFFNLLF